ncbi:MAG: hypothetical protein WA989_14855 [Henriciella sp.]|uniref:hypothetical protein n=1 Tax=Henriciella sp. TaxID=1968823 RepID=UPI003C78A60F
MRSTLCAAMLAVILAACETTPVAVELTPAEYQAAITEAESRWHPYLQIESLTGTLDTAVLSDRQRAGLLFERGTTRRLSRIDLPGAVSDFEAATALAAAPSLTENLNTELDFARADAAAAAARLAGLQTLPQWFDDIVAMGRVEEAAARQKASGLAPTVEHARLLEAAGYLCKDVDDGEDAEAWLGVPDEDISELNWCESPPVS